MTSVARVTTIDGKPSPATKTPLIAPRAAAGQQRPSTTSGIGKPAFASSPATTPQTPKCEPIEMSMCRPG